MNTKIKKLTKELNEANRSYYQEGRPTLSDSEFDVKLRELAALEKEFNEVDPNSPTQRVGSDISNVFTKVAHNKKMLSLDNVFNVGELKNFFKNVDCKLIVEPKIDGLSLSLHYKDGKLIRAVTRGDGESGDDVTQNAKTITDIPLSVEEIGEFEVRGEVYISNESFEKLNAKFIADGDEPFSSARNGAAGSLKQKSSAECAKRRLQFLAYGLLNIPFETEEEKLEALEEFGFNTSEYQIYKNPERITDDIITDIKSFVKGFNFEVDGAVFKVNQVSTQEELGNATKFPKWAVAYKFPTEKVVTTLIGITLQVGHTGTITPVAELEPVNLGGATVKRANLCNQDEIDRLGIDIGDQVFVARAAEVIPKIYGLAKKEPHSGNKTSVYQMPQTCPSCGEKITRDGVNYFCYNHNCPDQVLGRLKHALNKGSLDMDGCGEAFIKVLIENGVKDLEGIFTIEKLPESAASRKFFIEREKAKSAPLWRKIHSLGIELIGTTMSKELAQNFSSLDEMWGNAGKLKGILGEVKYDNFVKYIKENNNMIKKLDALGFKLSEKKADGGILTGKIFVITGTMITGTRDAVQEKIESLGGVCKSSVGSTTSYLIIGDSPGGSKLTAAKKKNIPTITETDLYKMIGEEMPAI